MDVKKYISVKIGVQENKILSESDLYRDLGLDGDDAYDFITDFSDQYKIDISEFVFNNYFGNEGISIIKFIEQLFLKKRFKSLKVKDLENALITKKLY